MPSALLPGDPVPADGRLPQQAAVAQGTRNFGAYVHVPYCRVRCGYCDFNTYTAKELGNTSRSHYASEVCDEISFSARALDDSGIKPRQLSTVFFGGGTPTILPATDLAQMLAKLRETFGIVAGAEVTTEANPDSVDREYLQTLKDAGFTRVSFGMQSAVPEVLQVLDRTHTPERVPQVVAWAKEAGLETSVDLIYGAPGETLEQWRRSVKAALACDPHHISAYALIVEPGTKLAAQIARGEYQQPDDDLHAEMYELADQEFAAAGYSWYEISNWSKTLDTRSRHNLAYWQGHDWWGYGPGAHSHVGGVRWWNVKHPRAYADRIAQGISPGFAREVLDAETRRVEQVLLETRIADGLPQSRLTASESRRVAELIANGLVDPVSALQHKRIVPTLRGRLLADTVVATLLAS
ncbi:radical SAM family heme chaperone HemW [Canibacter zhoujuaniae]|uniref:radical SAM family heme chaperone HemW n=1 Tax=Canibacter zhoujuaniae TaxID=2708343 RepID=UPI001423E6F6|nr:radical SAM family heme chaperone HemW [Canibacter zhoujuaniae]